MYFKKSIDFLFIHASILVIVALIDYYFQTLFFTLQIGALLFVIFIYKNWKNFTTYKSWGGIPNLVTLSRLLLLFTIPFLNSDEKLFFVSFIVICLDGLDGLLARKLNQVTAFGGRLDMEVDAFFCLIFSLLISFNYPELSWILIGGLLRYLYKIITFLISKSEFVEKKKNYARFIAGFYFLSFPFFFLTDYSIGVYFISFGTLLVIASFSVSFYEFFSFKK